MVRVGDMVDGWVVLSVADGNARMMRVGGELNPQCTVPVASLGAPIHHCTRCDATCRLYAAPRAECVECGAECATARGWDGTGEVPTCVDCARGDFGHANACDGKAGA